MSDWHTEILSDSDPEVRELIQKYWALCGGSDDESVTIEQEHVYLFGDEPEVEEVLTRVHSENFSDASAALDREVEVYRFADFWRPYHADSWLDASIDGVINFVTAWVSRDKATRQAMAGDLHELCSEQLARGASRLRCLLLIVWHGLRSLPKVMWAAVATAAWKLLGG